MPHPPRVSARRPRQPVPLRPICHYYIDEAGDSVLFNRAGKPIIGQDGCSRYFIIGCVEVANPVSLAHDLDALRAQLLADPFFATVPSMQPAQRKTAVAFHAKDDLPEVRREVMQLLRARDDLKFYAVVRDKQWLLNTVLARNQRDAAYRYNQNEVYDALVRRLFKKQLHKAEEYKLCFAQRGNRDRTTALREALAQTQREFRMQRHTAHLSQLSVTDCAYSEEACLQAADYYLWALQRVFERREDRYLIYLWPGVRRIEDADDRRQSGAGMFYTQQHPLQLSALIDRL